MNATTRTIGIIVLTSGLSACAGMSHTILLKNSALI